MKEHEHITKQDALERTDAEIERLWGVITSLMARAARLKDFRDKAHRSEGNRFLLNGNNVIMIVPESENTVKD